MEETREGGNPGKRGIALERGVKEGNSAGGASW